MTKYKEQGWGSFVVDLTTAKLTSYSAGLVFAFLLYLIIDLIFEEAQMAWPGFWGTPLHVG